jgi:hypothetical protein
MSPPSIRKEEKRIVHLDDLPLCQGPAWDERSEGGSSKNCWRGITVRTYPKGRMVRLIADVTNTTISKEGSGGMPIGYSGWIALRGEQCGINIQCQAMTDKQETTWQPLLGNISVNNGYC